MYNNRGKMKKDCTKNVALTKLSFIKNKNTLVSLPLIIMSFALSGCKAPQGTGYESYKTSNEQLEDRKVINNVRERFNTNPSIPSNLIHIAIDRGILQLSGFVHTHQEVDLAILTASSIPGVKDVINSLIVLSDSSYAKRRGAAEIENTKR